jgi:hypothetical protein
MGWARKPQFDESATDLSVIDKRYRAAMNDTIDLDQRSGFRGADRACVMPLMGRLPKPIT